MAKNKALKTFIQFIIAVLTAVFCVALIQQLLFMPVGVQGPSMEPTIKSSGETAYIQKSAYKLEVNDVIVFYRPLNEAAYSMTNPSQAKFNLKEFFTNFLHLKNSLNTDDNGANVDTNFICVIKRIVGMPKDTIEIKDAVLYRNGEKVEDFPMNKRETSGSAGVSDVELFTVPDNQYFVLGDNRDISFDSEDYGCIEKDWILGKVIMILSRNDGFKINFM